MLRHYFPKKCVPKYSNSLSKWIIGIILKGRHVLDFQNLFLSGVPSIIYEVNLEKRKNGLCVGHLLKKNEDFFSHNCHQKHNGEKRKTWQKTASDVGRFSKRKSKRITNKNVWNCILDMQPARHVFIAVLFGNGPSIFSLKAPKIFH